MDLSTGTDAGTVRDELIAALTAGDANLAEIIALDAVAEGMPVVDLYVDAIAPALAEIGHQWATRKLSVADEHLATGIAHDVMRLVSRTATRYPRRSRERVLLLAVGSELHTTGLRMIGDLAEGRGFDVRYLGAQLPAHALGDIIVKHEPEFVGISVTMAGSVPDLLAALDEVEASQYRPRATLVGGGAVTDALRDDPRVRYAPDARVAIEILEDLADPT
jgi:methanogenic corrinoid protein MtbC1